MKRAALVTGAVGLAVALSSCGGTVDDSTLGPIGSASPAASAPASEPAASEPAVTEAPTSEPTASEPTASEPALPTPSASEPAASAEPQECPITATPVPAPAGVSKDLAVKPTLPGNSAPPPTEVTVADVVVGTGAEATTLSAASVKYVGELYTDGTEFDSSWKTSADNTFDVTVCATGTVPGFAIAPTGMKVGGRRVVTIPAEYGYGAEGSPPTIPANAALVFIIDLVKVAPPAG